MGSLRRASLEYHGIAGSTLDCESAVVNLIQSGRTPVTARILTCESTHALFLIDQIGDQIVVKTGFSSGYGGTGPTSFSHILQLLDAHGCELDEVILTEPIMERLDASALTSVDVKKILSSQPISPRRVFGYVREKHFEAARNGRLWEEFDAPVPFAIVEPRLFDLALAFKDRPDGTLIEGYRRLEDRIRERTKLSLHGQRLFAKAFQDADAPLHWKGIDDGERNGRVNLFTGAFMAHRNPRAHRHKSQPFKVQLSEFLVLNHLFHLEREAAGPRRAKKKKARL